MTDIVGDLSTNATIAVGETRLSAIDAAFDTDWFRLDLSDGEEVQITLRGHGDQALIDPILNLYDATGALVAWNYDLSASNKNASLTFTASGNGPYYIEALASGPITGGYALSVAAAPTAPLQSILWGTQVETNEVSVYFAGPGEAIDGYTTESWSAYEIAQFHAAFALIEDVTNITFRQVAHPSSADLVLGADADEMPDTWYAYLYPPEETDAGTGMFNVAAWDRDPGGTLDIGGTGFAIIVHELLHGLGLAHPHDEGGTSTKMEGVEAAYWDYGSAGLNQGIYTVMTYNNGWNEGDVGTFGALSGDWGYETGPMALDIAALQFLYGANMTTRVGDDIYALTDENEQGTGWQSIWDAGGSDTIQYLGLADAIIDLRSATLDTDIGGGGYVSAARNIAGGFTIAHGVSIENAISGSGHDLIYGNGLANTIWSGDGNDEVFGDGGNDRITGFRGSDDIDTGDGNDWVSAGLGADVILGEDGDDIILAGQGDDEIHGGQGNDQIFGRKGRDTLFGDDGDDLLHGGSGNDEVWSGSGADVVTLGFGEDIFHFAAGDGADRVTDFNLGRDQIWLDQSLNLTAETLARALQDAQIEADGLTLDLGNGDTITLAGLTDVDRLADAIQLA